MIRNTSMEAYRAVCEDGTLSRRRQETYISLFRHGPCTGSELLKKHQKSGLNTTHSNIRARLGELRDLGLAEEVGERPCGVTGKNVIVWDVTAKVPTKNSSLSKEKRSKPNFKFIARGIVTWLGNAQGLIDLIEKSLEEAYAEGKKNAKKSYKKNPHQEDFGF